MSCFYPVPVICACIQRTVPILTNLSQGAVNISVSAHMQTWPFKVLSIRLEVEATKQKSDNDIQLLISAPKIWQNKQTEDVKVANEVKDIYQTFKETTEMIRGYLCRLNKLTRVYENRRNISNQDIQGEKDIVCLWRWSQTFPSWTGRWIRNAEFWHASNL